MIIKILGSGCSNCQRLENNVQKAVEELEFQAIIEKVTDIGLIMNYGIMGFPALVVDEEVVSYGKILSVQEIKEMLSETKSDKTKIGNGPIKSGGCACGGQC